MPPEHSRPDVALISPYPPLGTRHGGHSGVASYTANLAHALAEAGVAPLVVAPFADGEPEHGNDGQVRVQRAFAPGAGAVPRAFAAARASGAPVTHLQHELFLYGGPAATAGLLGGLAAAALRRPRQPVVVTLHQVVDPAQLDADFVRRHRVAAPAVLARAGMRTLQHALPRLATAAIVHERPFARLVPGARVVPHGVEVAGAGGPEVRDGDTRATARAELGLPDDRLVALCFGFVAPYKGLEVALDAAVLAGPRVQLVVAGGEHPRLAARGERYLDELRGRYGAHARFTGFVADRDVARWHRAADVAVLPYPAPHASSGALALALAYGTPILASPALGAACGVDELCRVRLDQAELAGRLLRLCDGPDAPGAIAERDQLHAATAALAAERSWPVVARAHREIYTDVEKEVGRAHGTARRRLRAA